MHSASFGHSGPRPRPGVVFPRGILFPLSFLSYSFLLLLLLLLPLSFLLINTALYSVQLVVGLHPQRSTLHSSSAWNLPPSPLLSSPFIDTTCWVFCHSNSKQTGRKIPFPLLSPFPSFLPPYTHSVAAIQRNETGNRGLTLRRHVTRLTSPDLRSILQ